MIEEIFTSVKAIPIQLSFNEFILLFEQYDWQDIINCIEDLHAIEHIDNLRSVYNYLRKLIIEDESIVMIHDITQNSYIQENF
jgi:hypothetical protein